MPRFVRPPDPADPASFEALVRDWWGYCERWAVRQEKLHPGRDFGPPANMALWKAGAKFDPSLGKPFWSLLRWELFSVRRVVLARRTLPGSSIPEEPSVPPRLPDGEPDFEARIAGLPPRQATAIRLRFVQGLTRDQTARTLGVSGRYVQRIQADALAALRPRPE